MIKKTAKTTNQNIRLCLMKTAHQRILLERLFFWSFGAGSEWYGRVNSDNDQSRT